MEGPRKEYFKIAILPKTLKERATSYSVKTFSIPPRSPDLNPIEKSLQRFCRESALIFKQLQQTGWSPREGTCFPESIQVLRQHDALGYILELLGRRNSPGSNAQIPFRIGSNLDNEATNFCNSENAHCAHCPQLSRHWTNGQKMFIYPIHPSDTR